MSSVVALRGAISGEHGIGLAKTQFMKMQYGQPSLDLMKKIKEVFDPHGILNPGKLFEPFSPWEYEKVDYSFPWDLAKK